MITLYAFGTPNSLKPVIALEELGLPYAYKPVNVRAGEQKAPDFLALNPNGKVPVILDPEGPDGAPIAVTESAAILIYLANKAGRLIPSDERRKTQMFEQLFFHASGLSPAFGNAGWFQKFAPEPIPVAIDRFLNEAKRTVGLLDKVLAGQDYVAGDYSIADIAHFGWLWRRAFVGIDFEGAPNVARWYAAIEARPAVQRAIAVIA